MKKTVLVIPCYNEADRLDLAAYYASLDHFPGLNYLMVNDGSADATAELLERMKGEKPGRIETLSLTHNSGKAEAVRQGVVKALGSDCDYIGYWDADLATPLEAVETFITLMEKEKPGLILGARVKLMGRDISRKLSRHYLGRIFATFASMVLGLAVYDTQCGAKLFVRSDEIKEAFARPFISKWIFDVELIARYTLATNGRPGAILETPLTQWKDVGGSKLRPYHFLLAFIDLVKIAQNYSSALYRLKGNG